ncbi:MAG: hypothetical protein Q7S96_03945 [bacterium]|nr:hypothetical protein [bacterium]
MHDGEDAETDDSLRRSGAESIAMSRHRATTTVAFVRDRGRLLLRFSTFREQRMLLKRGDVLVAIVGHRGETLQVRAVVSSSAFTALNDLHVQAFYAFPVRLWTASS